MAKILRVLLLSTLLAVSLCSCSSAAENKQTAARKGAQQAMKTYYLGRFAIDVPAEFKLAVQSHRFRLVEIKEYDKLQDAKQKWLDHLAEIEKLQKPKGIRKIVIQEQQIAGMGAWARGVLYYSDYMADDECNWDIFVSYGNSAALFSLKGLVDKQQSMFFWLQDVAKAYRPDLERRLSGNSQFHTMLGFIELPYKRQEQSYVRFEGPNGVVLRIEMQETHKVEVAGVMDRLMASLATNFAPGVDVDNIRTGIRAVAGLSGQEIITRLRDKSGKELFLAWDYQGKESSGEHPEIRIGMECPDTNLSETIQTWDKALDTFRVASKFSE